MKADQYRYWQSRPIHERLRAVWELTQEHYAMKGAAPDECAWKANFISRADLIAAKLASGRPQDLADVEAIRKALDSRH
jgi:hypothetical protein